MARIAIGRDIIPDAAHNTVMHFGRSQAVPLNSLPVPSLLRRVWMRLRFEVLPGTFAIAFGMTLTLCVRGYQFGGSNHNVYLIDALHHASGEVLLGGDWFTTQTLQYHAVFGLMTRALYRLGVVEPAFLLGQLVLIFFMHLGWFRLVMRLGGTRMTYLLSVLLFFILAGGLGLGVYEFMQDQAFLPSNIANVAMLWGLYFWIARKPGWSGFWLGVAGLFHLNYALVAIGLWGTLNAWRMWDTWRATGLRGRQALRQVFRSSNPRGLVIGSIMVLGISIGNVLIALPAILGQERPLPFDQFLALYVKLRHAHHYYPASWPLALWACFLLPIPFAGWAAWRRLTASPITEPQTPAASGSVQPSDDHSDAQDTDRRLGFTEAYAWQQAIRIFLLFALLLVISLVGAGIWYVSEALVKLSLHRFSIYVKLLSCIGTAWLVYNAGIWDRRLVRYVLIALPVLLGGAFLALLLSGHTGWKMVDWLASFVWRHRGVAGLAVILCAVLAIYEVIYARPWKRWRHDLLHAAGIMAMAAVLFFAWGRWLQVRVLPEDDAVYLRLCQWASANTPVDSLFLVPPQEQSFRLHAQRSIIVNFKGVPQLNGELVEWRDRLQDVLALDDLTVLQGRNLFDTLDRIGERYRQLPAAHLLEVARRRGADYLITERPIDSVHALQPDFAVESAAASYYLYRITR